MTRNSCYVNIKTIGYGFKPIQIHGGILARRKTGDPLIITPQDDSRAAAINKPVILRAIERTSLKAFEDFLGENVNQLTDILPKTMGHIETKKDLSTADVRAILVSALKKAPPELLTKLNIQEVVRKKSLTSPERVAEKRQATEQRMEIFRTRRNDNFKGIFTDIGQGLGGIASIVTGSTSLRATIPTAVSAALRLTVMPAAKLVGGVAAMGQVSRAYGYTASAGALAVAGWGVSMPMMDPAPYMPLMSSPAMMQEVCVENPVAQTSAANAVYVISDKISGTSDTEQLARSVMMHGAQHGVPAVALHYISYLETGKFRDTVANNSSATGFFQILDSTKMGYIKNHGKDTFLYKEAAQKIEDGTASNSDKLLVTTFDTIGRTKQDVLNAALEDQKLDPIQLHALTLAADPYVQADLVGASMAEMVPEIMEDGISSQKILELAAQYYAADHFLGMTTHRALSKMAVESPEETIGAKFPNVVSRNKGLLGPDMTAAEALQNIQVEFTRYVQKPAQAFEASYDASRTPVDLCLTEEAQKIFPDKISIFQASLYQSGLHEDYSRAVDYASWARDYAMAAIQHQTSAPPPSTPAGLVTEMARVAAPSSFAPATSMRPEPRPKHLEKQAEDVQVAGLSTSVKPRARPDGLAK